MSLFTTWVGRIVYPRPIALADLARLSELESQNSRLRDQCDKASLDVAHLSEIEKERDEALLIAVRLSDLEKERNEALSEVNRLSAIEKERDEGDTSFTVIMELVS